MADQQIKGVPEGLTEEALPGGATAVQGVPEGLSEEPIGAPPVGTKPTEQKSPEQPGFFKRLGQSFNLPTTGEEYMSAAKETRPKSMLEAAGQAAENLAPGVAQAGHMAWDTAKNMWKGTKEAAQEGAEAGQNIAEGGPVLQNMGKAIGGALRGTMQAVPFVGPAINTAGEDVSAGNIKGAAGGLTGVVGQLAIPEAIEYMTPKGIPATEPGLMGHEVPRTKAAIPEARPNPKPRIEYAEPTPAAASGLMRHEVPPATEPVPAANLNAKPRIEYAEPTPYVPPKVTPVKAEGLVGNEHIEPAPADKEITPEEVRSTPGTSMSPEGKAEVAAATGDAAHVKSAKEELGEAAPTSAVLDKALELKQGAEQSESAQVEAAAPEQVKPAEAPKANEETAEEAKTSPEDETAVNNVIKDLSEQDIIKAGKKYEVDHEDYDFKKRDENRHRVDRDRYAKDVTADIPDDMKQKLVKAAQAFDDADDTMFSDADRSSASRASRAKAIWDKAHEADIKPVSGGSPAADVESTKILSPNSSGESSASQEAINRSESEKRQGIKRYRVDSRSQRKVPIFGVDAVDARPNEYEHIIQVDKEGNETILDSGRKARPLRHN